jgi:hypothetical protein
MVYMDSIQIFLSYLEYTQGPKMGQLLEAMMEIRSGAVGSDHSSMVPYMFSQALQALGEVDVPVTINFLVQFSVLTRLGPETACLGACRQGCADARFKSRR